MAEYISKDEALKLIREDKVEITPNLLTIAMLAAPNGYSVEDCYKAINDTCDRHIKGIRNIPAADVQPVVRCINCKYYEGLACCELIGDCGGTNWFCGWGEPKEES